MTTFAETGKVRVTVQAACGNSMLQDSKIIQVLGEVLSFSLYFFVICHLHAIAGGVYVG